MNNNKNNIDEALDFVKKSLKEDDDSKKIKKEDEEQYILLDKIISKKELELSENEKSDPVFKVSNETNSIKDEGIKTVKTKNMKINKDIISKKKLLKKDKDPVANLVDKEIKPIIRKWINKNLRKFVKNIVIEEMKSISKATQKPSSR